MMKIKHYSKYIIGLAAVAALVCLLILWIPEAEHNNIIEIDMDDRISEEALRKAAPADEVGVLYFGFDLRRSIQEDVRQYTPFLKYLEKATGYRFRLRFPRGGSSVVDEIGRGDVQFAALGSVSYIHARLKYGVIPLVRGLNSSGKAEYRSVIVTAPGSAIRRIHDIRGKRFAFGDINSTQGHLIPRIILNKHGIKLNNLAAYEWTGSHHKCASAVAKRKFDAGGLQDILGKELAKEGIVKIIYTSEYYPSSGIAAGKDMPADVRAKVKRALIDFKPRGRDAAGLYNWENTEMPNGFKAAQDKDYTELKRWARRLGLLDKKKQGGIR